MLTDDQCQKMTMTMQTSGWTEVLRPILAARAQAAVKALCEAPEKREGESKASDDALRERVRACEYVLFAFENEVTVNRMNRLREQPQPNGAETAPTS